MDATDGGPRYADSIWGAIYEAFIDPGKGLAAAKRDYQYERYVSNLAEKGIDEVDLRLTFPDPEMINPYFYLPRFHIELSPHMIDSDLEVQTQAGKSTFWGSLVSLFIPSSWWSEVHALTIPVYGNTPMMAYENTSKLYERWLQNLEARGFTVHKDYQFPLGLRKKVAEEDRAPW